MPIQAWIWITVAVSVAGFCAFAWTMFNSRGFNARGSRMRSGPDDGQSRQGDRRKLARHERRIFKESQRLVKQGKFVPAAQLLEQIGLAREAIQTLESAGLIHDAAKILMRMQRHNRAGVIYARHGMWDRAAQCFKMANMPLEVAKCLREGGDLAQAGDYFERAGRMEEAADCFGQSGQVGRAAKILVGVGLREKAVEYWRKQVDEASDLRSLNVDADDLRVIVGCLAEGMHTESRLGELAIQHGRLADVIRGLLSRGMVSQAAELVARANGESIDSLMVQFKHSDGSAEGLAQILDRIGDHRRSGMLWERLEMFVEAAQAFENAEYFERAAYCYERAKDDANARRMRDKAKLAPKPNNLPSNLPATPFALADVATSSVAAEPSFDPESDAPTMIVSVPSPPQVELRPNDLDEPGEADKPARDDRFVQDSPMPTAPAQRVETPSAPKPPPRHANVVLGRFSLSEDDEEGRALDATMSGPPVTEMSSVFEARAPESPDVVAPTEIAIPAPDWSEVAAAPASSDADRAVFHRASFLADLDPGQKDQMWAIGQTTQWDEESPILTFNDEPRGLYVILSGVVSCYRLQGQREVYVDQMRDAESFGELWLLTGHPSAVKFVATKGTRIHVVDRTAFTQLLDRDGTIARKVYKRFTMRLLKRLLRSQNNYQNKIAS